MASSGQKQLEERQYNAPVHLPTGEEIVTLFIKKALSTFEKQTNKGKSDHKEIVAYLQSRLMMFNKRRPGELEALGEVPHCSFVPNDKVLRSSETNETNDCIVWLYIVWLGRCHLHSRRCPDDGQTIPRRWVFIRLRRTKYFISFETNDDCKRSPKRCVLKRCLWLCL